MIAGMKTLTLNALVSRPNAVKKLTSTGQAVTITEKGKALWVLTPADVAEEAGPDEAWWTEYFAELLSEKPQRGKSGAQIVIESRGKY